LEQEMASVVRFVCDAADEARPGGVVPYYYEVPQDFSMPCVYFPAMDVIARGGTLNSFQLEYVWKIEFFDVTAQDAGALALAVLQKARSKRNLIVLLSQDGSQTEEFLRLKDPAIKRLKGGTAQLILKWNSFREFAGQDHEKAGRFFADISQKGSDAG
jgi:hypothetical protein